MGFAPDEKTVDYHPKRQSAGSTSDDSRRRTTNLDGTSLHPFIEACSFARLIPFASIASIVPRVGKASTHAAVRMTDFLLRRPLIFCRSEGFTRALSPPFMCGNMFRGRWSGIPNVTVTSGHHMSLSLPIGARSIQAIGWNCMPTKTQSHGETSTAIKVHHQVTQTTLIGAGVAKAPVVPLALCSGMPVSTEC